MQAGVIREIEWAPPKEAAPFFVADQPPPEEYGPWQWAAAFERATGLMCAEDARGCRENGRLRCPVGASLHFWPSASREGFYESGPSTSPPRPIAGAVVCGSSAWQKAAKGDRARRVSAVRRLLPPSAC